MNSKNLAGLYSLDIFGVRKRVTEEVYGDFPEACRKFEPPSILRMTSPCISSYFRNLVLPGPAARAQHVWRVSPSEKEVTTILSYLGAFRNCDSKRRSPDPRCQPSLLTVILLLLTDVHELIHDCGVF